MSVGDNLPDGAVTLTFVIVTAYDRPSDTMRQECWPVAHATLVRSSRAPSRNHR
jgi:hypothetical protein